MEIQKICKSMEIQEFKSFEEIVEINITTQKMIEEMIDKNQRFKIKKGSEVKVVLKPEFRVEEEMGYELTFPKETNFHPSWLGYFHKCSDGEFEDTYNFQHKSEPIQQIVVKESDVEIVERGV